MDLSPILGPLLGKILTLPVLFFLLFVAFLCEVVKRMVRLSWAGAKDSALFNEGILYVLPLALGAGIAAAIQGSYPFPDFITNRVSAAMGGLVLGGASGFTFNRVKKLARLRTEQLESEIKSAKAEAQAKAKTSPTDTTPTA